MSYQVIICFMLQDNSNSQIFLAFSALLNLPVLSFSNFPILKKKPTYSPTLYFRYSYPLGRANDKRKISKV